MTKPSSPALRRKSRSWIAIVILAVAVAGIYLIIRSNQQQPPVSGFRFGGPGGGNRSTPVNATTARLGSLPVYIQGLGTVTPLSTAVVRSRAEGELLKIHFKEGQAVQAGDVLAEIDARPYDVALRQAEGQLARDQASLSNAQRNLTRYEAVRDTVTPQELDATRATFEGFQASVKVDQASVESAQLQLSYTRVVAPISGRVGLQQVNLGNLVRPSDANGLVIITQEQPIAIVFTIPEDSLPAVVGSLAKGRKLSVEAYDRGMKTRLATGQLLAVDNQIDPTTGTIKLKATFANEDQSLFPNQFVNIRLLVETLQDVVLIPASAVQLSSQGETVFVVKPDSTLERRIVTVGRSEGGVSAVTQGLNANETIVTEGLDRLRVGGKVTVQDPHAPPPAADAEAAPRHKDGAKRT